MGCDVKVFPSRAGEAAEILNSLLNHPSQRDSETHLTASCHSPSLLAFNCTTTTTPSVAPPTTPPTFTQSVPTSTL